MASDRLGFPWTFLWTLPKALFSIRTWTVELPNRSQRLSPLPLSFAWPLPFAAAANSVRNLDQGAAYLLICHDDVVLAPDAVRIMVVESLRSNAGIVGPKLVDWDEPDRLHCGGGKPHDQSEEQIERRPDETSDHGYQSHEAARRHYTEPTANHIADP